MIVYQGTRNRWKSFTLIFVLVAQLVLPCLAAVGDLDTSFNSPNGFVTVANARFAEIAIQPADSKILAVGTSTTAQGATLSLIVARFNPDGTLDSSFGTAGYRDRQRARSDDLRREPRPSARWENRRYRWQQGPATYCRRQLFRHAV